jgi:hypothetical protein
MRYQIDVVIENGTFKAKITDMLDQRREWIYASTSISDVHEWIVSRLDTKILDSLDNDFDLSELDDKIADGII